MQALWSRAGQAHLCGCKACFKAANGFVRQSTTRTTRRKPTFGEVLTACYTSILGSAAVLDATRKDIRRKELDRQLEEVKEQLADLEDNAPVRTDYPVGSIHNRFPGCLKFHEKQPIEVSQILNAITRKDSMAFPTRRSSSINWLWREFEFSPSKKNIATSKKTDYAILMKCLRMEERETNIAHRDPVSNIQLEQTELMIEELVDGLMSPVGVRSTARRASITTTKTPLQEQISELQQQRYPHYEHILLDDDNSRPTNRRALNKLLWKIIQPGSDPREMVHKVCYNLLVSKFPPNITTYNMMIAAFNRFGNHKLAQVVVDSFLNRSKLAPTQQTLVCLLNHYKEKKDLAGFYDIIQRMTGKDPLGIKIRRKLVNEVETHPQLWRWAETMDVAIHGYIVNERAWFDVDVSRAIIQGLLSFGRLEQAATLFVLCLQRGYNLGFRVMMQLFDHCIYEFSQPAAARVILAFKKDPEILNQKALQIPDLRRQFCEKFQQLLDICGLQLPADLMSSLGPTSEFQDTLPIEPPELGSQRLCLQFINILHQINAVDAGLAGFAKAISIISGRALPSNFRFKVTDRSMFCLDMHRYLLDRYSSLRGSQGPQIQTAAEVLEIQAVPEEELAEDDATLDALYHGAEMKTPEVVGVAISPYYLDQRQLNEARP